MYGGTSIGPARRAAGGLFTRPHLALVAEAGPEAIIPLSAGMRSRALGLWAETGLQLGVRPALVAGSEGTVNITNNISVTVHGSGNVDPDSIAGAIAVKLESVFRNMPRR